MRTATDMNRRYRESQDAELAAKVRAANAANAYAQELFPVLTALFRPLVGKPVVTKSGGLLDKIAKTMPDLPNGVGLSVYRHQSNYSLAWTVKACECYPSPLSGDNATYFETTVYVGDLQGQTLTRLCESYQDAPSWRSDYTVEEVLAKRKAAREAKEAYSEAASNCYPFGE